MQCPECQIDLEVLCLDCGNCPTCCICAEDDEDDELGVEEETIEEDDSL